MITFGGVFGMRMSASRPTERLNRLHFLIDTSMSSALLILNLVVTCVCGRVLGCRGSEWTSLGAILLAQPPPLRLLPLSAYCNDLNSLLLEATFRSDSLMHWRPALATEMTMLANSQLRCDVSASDALTSLLPPIT